MQTIGSRLDQYKGIGPGFDFLRIGLALCVLLTHSIYLVQGEQQQFAYPPYRLLHDTMMPMFFALSGFLITGSALRLKLRDFLINRAVRILPGLTLIILLSALAIGPLFTTFSLKNYFHSRDFLLYFTNIFFWMRFSLPGVFEHNPMPSIVNGSLWTIPFEVTCYFIMSGLVISNALRKKWLGLGITIFAAIAIATGLSKNIFYNSEMAIGNVQLIHRMFHYFTLARGVQLYIYFLAGSMFFIFRHKIAFNYKLLGISLLVFILAIFDLLNWLPMVFQILVVCPAIVYITIFIGLTRIPEIPVYSHGDYSYGVYLYGYPLQQMLIALFPQLKSAALHFLLSVILATVMAILSWHFLEKPILSFRHKFSFTARKGDQKASLPLNATGK